MVGEGAVIVSDRKPAGEYKLLLMKIEVLYKALLDLEADQLKLNALPTGAPLREQVRQEVFWIFFGKMLKLFSSQHEILLFLFQISGEEVTHLSILQSGLASSDLVQDCLAVAKVEKYCHQNILIFPNYFQGRNLILRGLSKVPPSSLILNTILGEKERSDSDWREVDGEMFLFQEISTWWPGTTARTSTSGLCWPNTLIPRGESSLVRSHQTCRDFTITLHRQYDDIWIICGHSVLSVAPGSASYSPHLVLILKTGR